MPTFLSDNEIVLSVVRLQAHPTRCPYVKTAQQVTDLAHYDDDTRHVCATGPAKHSKPNTLTSRRQWVSRSRSARLCRHCKLVLPAMGVVSIFFNDNKSCLKRTCTHQKCKKLRAVLKYAPLSRTRHKTLERQFCLALYLIGKHVFHISKLLREVRTLVNKLSVQALCTFSSTTASAEIYRVLPKKRRCASDSS